MVPKLYRIFYDNRVFKLEDAVPHFPDVQQARNAIHYMKKNGYLKQIKAGLYCVIPFEYHGNESYSPDVILIGSKLVEPYFFSHRTALHIYGYIDVQVPQIVVTSTQRFKRFTFQERVFRNFHTKNFFGFKQHPYKENLDIYISDHERTFLDCLNRLNLAGGFGFFRTMYSFGFLNYPLLMEYLEKMKNKTLVAKVGFTLDFFKNRWDVPPDVLVELKNQIKGDTIYYLDRDIAEGFRKLDTTWNIIIPKSFNELARPI